MRLNSLFKISYLQNDSNIRLLKTVGFVLVILIIFIFQMAGFHDYRFDDSYITFHYGQNLALGNGLVFNPGEKIMGSTSPGQALLSGLVYFLFGKSNVLFLMITISCIAWMAMAVATYFLFKKTIGVAGAIFIGLMVAFGASQIARFIALETSIVLAFTLWTIVAYIDSKWFWVGVLGALAGFFRPDAFIIPVLLFVPCIIELKRQAWKPIVTFITITIPWFIFAWLYYGSILPQSAVKKFQVISVSSYAYHLFWYPTKHLQLLFEQSVTSAIIVWMIILLGAVLLFLKNKKMWILPAYAVVHFCAYLYLRPFPGHAWHIQPLLLVATILFLIPFVMSYNVVKNRRILAIAMLLIMVGIGYKFGSNTYSFATAHTSEYWYGYRDRSYIATSKYLLENSEPGDGISSVEVGTFGFLTNMKMNDLGGLITKDPKLKNSKYRWIVLDEKFRNYMPKDETPVAVFKVGLFTTYLFDLKSATDNN